jgi:hypothetical protein
VQLRNQKQRNEKFRTEQVAQWEKELSEKDSEIHVLKDMVKATQLQLKVKERDTARYR